LRCQRPGCGALQAPACGRLGRRSAGSGKQPGGDGWVTVRRGAPCGRPFPVAWIRRLASQERGGEAEPRGSWGRSMCSCAGAHAWTRNALHLREANCCTARAGEPREGLWTRSRDECSQRVSGKLCMQLLGTGRFRAVATVTLAPIVAPAFSHSGSVGSVVWMHPRAGCTWLGTHHGSGTEGRFTRLDSGVTPRTRHAGQG
jgi:hypothetical protein